MTALLALAITATVMACAIVASGTPLVLH